MSVKWTEGRFNRWTADLGSRLILFVYWSEIDVRGNKPWQAEVFGKSIGGFAMLEKARDAAESKAIEVLEEALKILEGQ